ncbi:hypothetical protein [Streptomyces tsukubensis]|uniref:Uncharacterized protein n=1 Tax=Streptomyces tsukubensis TaxID=83656 RepID=A0A1V4ABL7_9ACTN|nr:hypothetical protein [Streptomyces tsukubensis]OON81266.1 hypothetical protein B1H18_07860 [Streptomyces tsukubensis]QFR95622.1 hypothetical protein GBW32_24590 [Streptomyces tsukubensis]
MNILGTIDRPHTHDPQKQAPMQPSPRESTGLVTSETTTDVSATCQNRTREMQLIPEAMARAHIDERLRQAEAERPALRLMAARRMQRRAERASMRARRALAVAVMQ